MSIAKRAGPGFEAEASLYQSNRSYRTAAGSITGWASDTVAPQARVGTGVGGLGGLGGIFTDIGCYMSYGFCMLGCGLEWLKWADISTDVANGLFELCAAECDVELLRCRIGLPPSPGIPFV